MDFLFNYSKLFAILSPIIILDQEKLENNINIH